MITLKVANPPDDRDQQLKTDAATAAKANLIGHLSELGYDPSRCELAGLRTRPDQASLLGLIRENLSQHGIASALQKPPPGWPHGEDILVISNKAGKDSAPLNRFAAWVQREMMGAKLFFDPLIGSMLASKGSAGPWGISLPLSLAIEPERLWHPDDPTFGHELFHFLSSSLFNRGVPVVFKVELTPKEPFIGSCQYNPGQSAEELLAHRYNLKHALGRLARSTPNNTLNAEGVDAQTAIITEIIYMGDFAAKTIELIEDYTKAMLSDERYVQLDYQRFEGGYSVKLSLPREDQSTGIQVWTRETTEEGVHRAMVDYFERLHALSSAIRDVSKDFMPQFLKTKFFQHLSNDSKEQFSEYEPNLVSLLQTSGNRILALYRQNDFTLTKYALEPNELFDGLRQSLGAPKSIAKSDSDTEKSREDRDTLLGRVWKLLGG